MWRANWKLLCFAGWIYCALSPASAETAKLDIVGTGDGMEVLRALGSAFSEQHKSVDVVIPPSIGSGGGIAAVGSGKSILSRVARKLTDAEIASGIRYQPIARLPASFFTHPGAGVTSVTSAQLLDIYAGRVTNWKELGGNDLRIRVVRREDTDSTLAVLRASMPGWKDLAITEKSKTATTTQEAVETTRDVPGAIGFGPFHKSLERGLTVLKIDGHQPTDDGYPSSVELALIFTEKTLTPDARDFVNFVSTEKSNSVISALGSVPIRR
ncbi:MAG: PstS family phosphate ABC transporter substrate-binding protein [Pseudolabrys sp.]